MADIRDDAASPAPPAYSALASNERAEDVMQFQTLMHSLRRTKVTLLRAIDAYQESMMLLRGLEARDDR